MSYKLMTKLRPIKCFSSLFVFMNARLTNQRGQLADQVHVMGNIIYFVERKYHEKFSSRLEKYNI